MITLLHSQILQQVVNFVLQLWTQQSLIFKLGFQCIVLL